MRRLKGLILGVVVALVMSVATVGWAAPISFVYNDTVSIGPGGTLLTGISVGDPASVTVTLDNGNATNISQTWTANDLQSVTFNFNNGGLVTTFSDPFDGGLFRGIGNFETDGTGMLTAVLGNWEDRNANTDFATNGPALGTDFDWFLNGNNDVYFEDNSARQAGFNNVANIENPASWSQVAPVPVPSAILLMGTGLLGLIGYRKWSTKHS